MPSVPHNSSSSKPPLSTPHTPTHQPSPAVTSSSSHTHVLPRRFLGPMPENVVNSDELVEKRRRFRRIRRGAVRRLRGSSEDLNLGEPSERRGLRGAVKRIHVVRFGKRRTVEVDLMDEESSSSDNESEEDTHNGRWTRIKRKKKRQQRKDVWLGDSFEIGREFNATFVPPSRSDSPTSEDGEDGMQAESSEMARTRPTSQRTQTRSTQESFVTARTEFSSVHDGPSDGGSLDGYSLNDGPRPQVSGGSTASLPLPLVNVRKSQTSSMQPLLDHPPDHDENYGRKATDRMPMSPTLKKRLKSAIRSPSKRSAPPAAPQPPSTEERDRPTRSKTVQFPVDPVQRDSQENGVDEEDLARKGNKAPVDPEEVLGREGEDAVGTSSGAAEEAMGEDDDEDDDDAGVLPGEVMMRDRMLVRVGYHREESIPQFDEAAQRRNPCARLEPMEEYIVVWRRGRVEFYQDWRFKIKERWKGVKHLCFIVPLLPSRSTLSVFNDTDLTLSLITSANKLHDDMDHILRASTSKYGVMKSRVSQSRQAQWLRKGERGSHVFLMKVCERSRAMDWYWELWRELGGELPERLDVQIPGLETSVRLKVPEDPDMVGGRKTQRELSADKVVERCWEMMRGAIDVERLKRERGGEAPDLRLAWKGVGFEWIEGERTVQGAKRSWDLLAGAAKATTSRHPIILQLRPAPHEPSDMLLEDATRLNEPPSIEGYLLRHKSASQPKQHIYAQTHDGNIFISPMTNARPPARPGKEGITPGDVFPEVRAAFWQEEKKRLGQGMRSVSGFVDLRDVEYVEMVVKGDGLGEVGQLGEEDGDKEGRKGKKAERCFDVKLVSGGEVRFEAHTQAIAQSWVDSLSQLIVYWKRRHRVDARLRMDVTAQMASPDKTDGVDFLGDVFDWCVIEGCRAICSSGRLYMKKGPWDKFRAKYIVIADGYLIDFKLKTKQTFHSRKKVYPLFGAYIYSGMLAQEELHESTVENPMGRQARVYQDGLQSSDGAEDTTFCVRLLTKSSYWGKGKKRAQPWDLEDDAEYAVPGLTTKPAKLLIFRARSKLERDRWVWAINAELERQARAHVGHGERLRNHGNVPTR